MAATRTIGMRLTWIARMLRTRFDARARSIGLTRAQWRMIVTIHLAEGATQKHLAQQLEISSVTAGRILDRLVAVGCVERRADPVDRRANRVYLTSVAVPLMEVLGALGAEEEQLMTRGLSPEEIATFSALLQRVVENIQAGPALEAADDEDDFEKTL
ncbi:MarR family winged helix-turn-helix transcriptional regulator [Sphingomonas solaris]|uniref:MarR family transcriptional regulator n=1 Tax=Alterirhizorhabdus solaris TaxID=2529389 RepID=A0A558RBN4_9SPHN|nr:MarR family transcriptional regulator [Sphingomonas solaris]TVV76763.1 MarR family transcriptional regulator [Sphingomonas solaris]